MKIKGTHQEMIWVSPSNPMLVQTYDQRYFPHQIEIFDIASHEEAVFAIKEMVVRGAPLIGITGAFGYYLTYLEYGSQGKLFKQKVKELRQARPTAVNLDWAIDQMEKYHQSSSKIGAQQLLEKAIELKNDDIETCRQIGENGLALIEEISKKKEGETVNILTHCNAGWLACIDWGTATSPIYQAHQKGIKVHVYVDETRPRNQGANLTAFELGQEGVPHTLIVDNTGGHLMQHGMVDMVIVGTDRTTKTGDVANKIGTYLKALAAHDNGVPFYVALPSSTIDWEMSDGLKEIPIETRSEKEVKYMQGLYNKKMVEVLIAPNATKAVNYGFDVTPARLVTKLITEKGVCDANEESIKALFND